MERHLNSSVLMHWRKDTCIAERHYGKPIDLYRSGVNGHMTAPHSEEERAPNFIQQEAVLHGEQWKWRCPDAKQTSTNARTCGQRNNHDLNCANTSDQL
mmetsp:Transcript_2824/g.17579  ORF Transcript_2824/g.17579 Transcript_2824/m.17579 type:complete len:99 (+) Transcript_2824:305-601(+)